MKKFKTKEDLITKLIVVGYLYAEKLGYKRQEDEDSFQGLFSEIPQNWKDKVWYEDKLDGGKITIRPRFGGYRIDVYLPKKEGFASIEFNRTFKNNRKYGYYKYTESQVFGEKGIVLFNHLIKEFE